MKVFLGGTVNGSSWRKYIIRGLKINYFDPVVADWTPEAMERERYERRHCHFCLYVITPKMTGFYSIAEVIDDSIKRPDRTLYCYLAEDGPDQFSQADLLQLDHIAKRIQTHGAYVCADLDAVITLLNTTQTKQGLCNVCKGQRYDSYLSYGRNDSREITQWISTQLKEQGISNWYDTSPTPQEIEFLDEINCLIREAKLFIFVASPHSLSSEYCQRELEYAVKLGKHVIVLSTMEKVTLPSKLTPDKVLIISHNKYDTGVIEQLRDHFTSLNSELTHHTQFLVRASCWEQLEYHPDHLLYGRTRKAAFKWLKKQACSEGALAVTIPDLVSQYIEQSWGQALTKRTMFRLSVISGGIIEHRWFDSYFSLTALANPLAMLPQLWVLINAANADAISISTWLIFFMLQLSSTFFAIKQRNFGLCIAQFLSMLISGFIIALVTIK